MDLFSLEMKSDVGVNAVTVNAPKPVIMIQDYRICSRGYLSCTERLNTLNLLQISFR